MQPGDDLVVRTRVVQQSIHELRVSPAGRRRITLGGDGTLCGRDTGCLVPVSHIFPHFERVGTRVDPSSLPMFLRDGVRALVEARGVDVRRDEGRCFAGRPVLRIERRRFRGSPNLVSTGGRSTKIHASAV